MYRIFSMSSEGRLYQLSSRGWVVAEGSAFRDIREVGDFLNNNFVPALPDGQVMLDSYVALVDCFGSIRYTFAYSDVCFKDAAFEEMNDGSDLSG